MRRSQRVTRAPVRCDDYVDPATVNVGRRADRGHSTQVACSTVGSANMLISDGLYIYWPLLRDRLCIV